MIKKLGTKELLAESLKDLSKIKSVDKITVEELAKNCGLTAPTFYQKRAVKAPCFSYGDETAQIILVIF